MDQSTFRSSWIEIISGQNYTHFVTLHWNKGAMTIDVMRQNLRSFHRRVDRSRLGRRFWRKPEATRSTAVFLIEKQDTSAHVHSFWKSPSTLCGMGVEAFLTADEWRAVVPSGTLLAEPIRQAETAANYALKGQHARTDADTILFSRDF